MVEEDGYTFAELAARLQSSASPAKTLTQQALATCTEQERRLLAVLAIPKASTLGERHVSALLGIADVSPMVDSLQQRGLAQSHSPRYSLTGSLYETLREEWYLTSWNERALEYFAAWAEEQREAPERGAEEADAILGILRWALQEGRWQEALRLGQAVEGPLALSGQWSAWAQVLGWEMQAARALGDRTVEARSLHQSGTRALCLEDTSTVHENLTEALHLRESLGDWEGAAVTRHNLELLGFGGPDGDSEPEGNGSGGSGDGGSSGWWSSGGGGGGTGLWLGAIGLVAALVVLGAYLFTPPAPFSLTLSPNRIEVGRTSEGTVTLSDPAPSGGVTVELSSSNPEIVKVDPSITTKEGSTTGAFIISASSASASSVSASPESSALIQPRLVAFQVTPPGCSVDGDNIYCPPPPPPPPPTCETDPNLCPPPPPLPPPPDTCETNPSLCPTPPPPPDPPPPPPDPTSPPPEPPPGREICGNEIDDDEQGAIDENCEESRPGRSSPPKSPSSPSSKTSPPPEPAPDKQQSVEVTVTASWLGMEQSATLTVQTGQTKRSKTETNTKTPIAVGLVRTVPRSLKVS